MDDINATSQTQLVTNLNKVFHLASKHYQRKVLLDRQVLVYILASTLLFFFLKIVFYTLLYLSLVLRKKKTNKVILGIYPITKSLKQFIEKVSHVGWQKIPQKLSTIESFS